MTKKEKLLEDLDLLSYFDREDYQKLVSPQVEAITPKAALIDGRWLPKSQMRCDTDGNIYVSNWISIKI